MLAFRVRNEGEEKALPIIYIHGAMSNKNFWLMLSRALAQKIPGRAGYLVDLPGHGQTEGPGCTAIADYAAEVLQFMDEKKIEKASLAGHSMGGAISQWIAIHHPKRVEKLTLISTGATLGVSPQIIDSLRDNFDMAVSMIKDFSFGPDVAKEVYEPIIDQMRAVGSQTSVGDFEACNGFNVIDDLGKLSAPTLVCCGEKDFLTPPGKNKKLAESLGAKYVEMENAGHMLPIERPIDLAEAVAFFLGE